MSAMIDEDWAATPRLGLGTGFADGPPGGADRADLWRRIWFTIGALILYRLGGYLPIPGLDPQGIRELFGRDDWGVLGLLDLLTGGAMWRLSIFALGIAPYISAFIILQLVSAIAPRLGRLGAEGPAGRRAVNQYARILTVVIAGVQAVGVAFALEAMPGLVAAPSLLFEATAVLTLVTGTIFLMWLAEQITERGIGDGVLVILACGIVGRLPFDLSTLFEMVKTGDLEAYWPLATLLLMVAIIALVVVVERAVRWIPVHDPGKTISSGDSAGRYVHLALRLNPAGILAPLAASVLATPVWDLVLGAGGRDTPFLSHLASTGIGYVLANGLLMVLFGVFFGLAVLDSAQIAKKLTDSGGWIPGFRSGENTARYLRRTQIILALIGTAYLVTACVLPELIYRRFYWPLPLPGLEFFLLAWVMVHILERVRPALRS
jgi:preprotein translocase subunit SecY